MKKINVLLIFFILSLISINVYSFAFLAPAVVPSAVTAISAGVRSAIGAFAKAYPVNNALTPLIMTSGGIWALNSPSQNVDLYGATGLDASPLPYSSSGSLVVLTSSTPYVFTFYNRAYTGEFYISPSTGLPTAYEYFDQTQYKITFSYESGTLLSDNSAVKVGCTADVQTYPTQYNQWSSSELPAFISVSGDVGASEAFLSQDIASNCVSPPAPDLSYSLQGEYAFSYDPSNVNAPYSLTDLETGEESSPSDVEQFGLVDVYRALNDAGDAVGEFGISASEFATSLWDSLLNKPDDYSSLDYNQAVDRANFINGNEVGSIDYDEDILFTSDVLPTRPIYVPPDVTQTLLPPVSVVVDNFDSDGNYESTTVTNFDVYEQFTDGVSDGLYETPSTSSTSYDPFSAGLTSLPNSNVVISNTTSIPDENVIPIATAVPLPTPSSSAENDLSNGLLSQILGAVAGVDNSVNQVNASVNGVNNTLNNIFQPSDPTTSISVDSSEVVAEATALESEFSPFDFIAPVVDISVPVTSCSSYQMVLNVNGSNYDFEISGLCSAMEIFGLFFYSFSFYWSFLIVSRAFI